MKCPPPTLPQVTNSLSCHAILYFLGDATINRVSSRGFFLLMISPKRLLISRIEQISLQDRKLIQVPIIGCYCKYYLVICRVNHRSTQAVPVAYSETSAAT